MKELKVQDVTLTYGEKTLFDSISFSIMEGEKIGLIGVNGTGKSHLMNILSGISKPEKGKIEKPKDFSVAYLRQDPKLDPEDSVLEAVFAGENPVMQTVREYEEALELLGKDSENKKNQERFTRAEEKMNSQNAWTADAQAKNILTSLGIHDLGAPVSTLSGGQAKRVGLAQVLIEEPDLLLLDEPTNHLDFQTIQWLERYLMRYKGALMMVTHDRYFLERVVKEIMELSQGKIYSYEGNYEVYLTQKAEREEMAVQQEHKKRQLYKQELAWMRTGARARSTKQEARKQRFHDLEASMDTDRNQQGLEMGLSSSHIGKQVIELKNASYSLKEHVILNHFNLLIQNRERLGITGQNGAGKTTFLDLLAGYKSLDEGDLLIGETVRIAYYTQTSKGLDDDKRVIQFLQEIAEEVHTEDGHRLSVSQLLERFLFPKSSHGTLIGRLSGGEKRRLYLLSLLMQQPNVLLLDEPTNDLDLDTLAVLEEYIETFEGVVISVSHDRYFLDKTSDQLLVFNGEGMIEPFYGTLSEYQEIEQENLKTGEQFSVPLTKMKQEKISSHPSQPKEKVKLTFKEQKEWETIEEDLFELEAKIEETEQEMAKNGSNYEQIASLEEERQKLKRQFDKKMSRWEYLSQFAD